MANIKRANTSGITKTGVAISDVPDAPTIGAVADLGTGSTASVAYTAATTGGAATTFTATSSPGGLTGTGSSPITVSGLSANTAYTFTVTASNSTGSNASAASSSLTLIAVGAYESIASQTVGAGGSSSITFTSIPSTYTHLQLRFTGRANLAGNVFSAGIRYNSDSGSNYSFHFIYGNGTSALTSVGANQTTDYSASLMGTTPTNNFAVNIIDILDYANTNKFKTIRTLSGGDVNGAGGFIGLSSVLWRSTSAINSITISSDGYGDLLQYSTFALYGIRGA